MLDKVYSPRDTEDRIYKKWLSQGSFHAIVDKGKKPYTIVIPPPNITGQLHMGHALDNTIQDILIRWRRMQGYSALWMPGTDHASIATEAKIVEAIEAEGLTKAELGREEFLRRAWEWRRLYGGRIIEQLKRLGCSCDWERERFTMDAGLSAAVTHVFARLYEDGLIYKGERIINWCPGCRTSISDIEVEYSEMDGQFWYLRYPVKGFDGEYITVATTRPETMLGDTAVAVHPDDPRYKKYIGKKAVLPLVGRELPIIADEYADSELGSGAVKITPAHDPNDFEIGLRHGLEMIRVIDDGGVMNENAGAYRGLSREAARKKIVADLGELGLIDKTERHVFNVGECSRCGTIIEPVASSQWFVKMGPLAKPAIEAVKDGRIHFVPERFSRIYYNWMENIQDWCISRQLWWGHRIPAYYCDGCGETYVAESSPGACSKCGAPLRQDDDVLDTWFSSALWPFSTLGWPEETAEMKYFYPTDVLVTGYDIIFFWVARMIFSGLRHTGMEPFKYVYIHGMLRDEQGRKMSKSLGNGIDPLDVVDVYGADSLRFALTIGNAPGGDLRFSEDKVKSARNFANKLWNASRFVLSHLADEGAGQPGETGGAKTGTAPGAAVAGLTADDAGLSAVDRWILSELNRHVREINDNLEKFELGVALQKIYDFIWDYFCDWYIEFVKPVLQKESPGNASDSADKSIRAGGGDANEPGAAGGRDANESGAAGGGKPERAAALLVLRYVLTQSLKLLHPFMPFITEEIYQTLALHADIKGRDGLCAVMSDAGKAGGIMIDEWPCPIDMLSDEACSGKISLIIDIIRAVRNLRSEMKVPPSKKIICSFVTPDSDTKGILEESRPYIERLASIQSFDIRPDKSGISSDAAALVIGAIEAYIPMGELIDAAKEKERLEKELASADSEIERAQKNMANPGFINKAPQRIVEEERRKLASLIETRAKIIENLERFN